MARKRRQRRPRGGKANVPTLTPAQEARRPAYQRRSTFLANETLGTSRGLTAGKTGKAGPKFTTQKQSYPSVAQPEKTTIAGRPSKQRVKKTGDVPSTQHQRFDEVARCKARPPNNERAGGSGGGGTPPRGKKNQGVLSLGVSKGRSRIDR